MYNYLLDDTVILLDGINKIIKIKKILLFYI